jgi:hypothetical protein
MTMEYTFETRKNSAVRSVTEKYLKYKYAKEARDKKSRLDRWVKLNREDVVEEKFTRAEKWDNFIKELSVR